jgi:predicted 3-demethylubiquinone-9 3-methyltransferase (glyoxalase superfamily)
LNGQHFTALNGGPHYSFTPAISFVIMCDDQEEVDHYWDNFLQGGKAMQCGWITDKFGLSWQVVPSAMITMMTDKDPKKAQKVAQAMMKMVKLDIAGLQKAYDEA